MTTDIQQRFILECFKRVNPSPIWLTTKPDENDPAYNDYIVVNDEGKLKLVHYACDMSGEEQPAFKGWFYWNGNSFLPISKIQQWCHCPNYCKNNEEIMKVITTLSGASLMYYAGCCNDINEKLPVDSVRYAQATNYLDVKIKILCDIFNIK
jgi:hypothetical protein